MAYNLGVSSIEKLEEQGVFRLGPISEGVGTAPTVEREAGVSRHPGRQPAWGAR